MGSAFVLAALSNNANKKFNHIYSSGIIALCLVYLLIQFFYVPFALLSLDDFWLAYHSHHYKTGLPYRDFLPYKTVLGYYVFLLPMSFFQGLLSPLVYTKLWIVLINTGFLLGIAFWLRKFFNAKAIFISLMLIISSQLFLSYSSDIRVDLLAYWLCLVSVIFLFEARFFFAGIVIALAFLTCQKAVWYLIATNCGLAGYWLIEQRNWKTIKNVIIFNFSALITLLVYIAFWAYFSSLTIVLKSVFYEAYLISSVDWYVSTNNELWYFIILNNPGFILLWPLALFGLFFLPSQGRVFIAIYSLVIWLFIITCKQSFPYYSLAAIPVLVVLFSAFFSAYYASVPFHYFTQRQKKYLLGFTGLYIFGMLLLTYRFVFPTVYLLATLIPMLIYVSVAYDIGKELRSVFMLTIAALFIVIGIIFPLVRFVGTLPRANGHYQRSMIYLTNNLLRDGGSYIAGVPLIYAREQPVPGLVHLVGPTIYYLYRPSKKLYPIMTLSSLYFTPDTAAQIIESIKKAPVKLYVDNDRFHALPPEIHRFLATQYQHFWGSVYLYAPEINRGHQFVQIKFAGNYKVQAQKNALISMDNKKIMPNTIIHLASQQYTSDANVSYRLELIPDLQSHFLEPEFQNNDWNIMLD